MQSDIKSIKKHFQKSMDKYSDNAIVQRYVAKILVDSLDKNFYDSVLEIGAGAGVLTEIFSDKCDFNEYYANDIVEKSEKYVRKYVDIVRFFAGDFRKVKFNKKFDLVISNAVFQWFENIDKIFEKCEKLLNYNGVLAFSTFAPDNFKEIREILGVSLDYKSVEDLTESLNKKFDIIKVENFEYVLNFDNPLKILAHMKNTGVNSLSQNMWGIKEVKRFCEEYLRMFPNLTLTYSPIIVLAKLK